MVVVPVDPSDPLVAGAGALGAYLAGDANPTRAALYALAIAAFARLVVDAQTGAVGSATAFRALASGAFAALATAARVARLNNDARRQLDDAAGRVAVDDKGAPVDDKTKIVRVRVDRPPSDRL